MERMIYVASMKYILHFRPHRSFFSPSHHDLLHYQTMNYHEPRVDIPYLEVQVQEGSQILAAKIYEAWGGALGSDKSSKAYLESYRRVSSGTEWAPQKVA